MEPNLKSIAKILIQKGTLVRVSSLYPAWNENLIRVLEIPEDNQFWGWNESAKFLRPNVGMIIDYAFNALLPDGFAYKILFSDGRRVKIFFVSRAQNRIEVLSKQ